MPFATSHRLLLRILTFCCTAVLCATVVAQSPVTSESVEFAGAAICAPNRIEIPAKLKNAPADGPIEIEADDIETEGESIVILRGSAEVVRGSRGLYAERIVFHRDTYRANAEGDVVFYTANGDEIRAAKLDLEVDTYIGEGSDVRIQLADNDSVHDNTYARARATAQTVNFEGDDFQRLNHVTMTTCAEGNEDVQLSAEEITLDHAAGVGTAKAMTVKFKNTPIFYFPTATFPINDQRKSGFLFPAAGYANDAGIMVAAPYYFNLAPQYDATVTPRIWSKRGVQLFGEFRHLGENSRGDLRGEVLPSDNQYNGEDRYAFAYDYRHDFDERWRAILDWQTISDSDYPSDFANDADVVASSYIPKKAELDYFGKALRFNARAAAYDSADDTISRSDRPYDTLPQLALELKPRKLGLLQGQLDTQYSNFRHDESSKIHGTRLRVRPSVSLPLVKNYGYIVPKVSVQAIQYSLNGTERDRTRYPDDSPSVEIPVYSIDGRLFFERPFDGPSEPGDASWVQTLEPRLFYLNIPEKRQQIEFPNFDSSAGSDSSFEHFFRENRFFGGDWVGDTEQLAVGVTSRILDNTGGQRLKLSLGQVFYLKDRKLVSSNTQDSDAQVSDAQANTETTSGWFGEVSAAISERWQVTGFARRKDDRGSLDAVRLSADYHRDARRNASLAYTFQDHFSEQINLAFQAPLGPRWQLHGSRAYSFKEDDVRSASIGFSYDGCCWAVRVAAQRYLDGDGAQNNRFVFTFELDDLGRINSQL